MADARAGEFWGVFRKERAAYVSAALAEKERRRVGDRLPVLINDRTEELEIAGLLPRPAGGGEAPEGLILMDLPAVQALGRTPGRIGRIECLVGARRAGGAVPRGDARALARAPRALAGLLAE